VPGKTTKQYLSYSEIQRKLRRPTHLQNACCFGKPTYQPNRRRFANDHANVQQNEKLTLFIDYFVRQKIANQNVPIEIWNTIKFRHRINKTDEGWNSKLNSIIGKQQSNVFSAGTEIKTEREVGILATEIKEPGEPGQKRRKTCVKQEERITKIMEEYCISDDLYNCPKALNYTTNVNNYK
jgi:hypothetical protein